MGLLLTRRAVARYVMLFIILGQTPNVLGVVQGNVNVHRFPVPQRVAEQVWFWERVFRDYPRSSVIIHDQIAPDLIIDVIDLKAFAKVYNRDRPYTSRERNLIAKKYIDRYEKGILRFAKEGQKAVRHGAMEQRLYNIYKKKPQHLRRLYSGQARLRSQSGLADEFLEAVKRAEIYLPYMEQIFIERGLPKDLTRIAFVESMFNITAISKVGASGLWQFMPGTAKSYLTLNQHVDERNSPIKATDAAARFLLSNFRTLKSWPLAVTAYNHGAGGMSRAVRQTKSQDLGVIIDRYQSPSFGFASRNFYAEFLAARNVYNKYHFPSRSKAANPLGITKIKLGKPLSVYQLTKLTPLNNELLKKYNPCLLPNAYGAQFKTNLPSNFELILPEKMAGSMRTALNQISSPAKGRSAL